MSLFKKITDLLKKDSISEKKTELRNINLNITEISLNNVIGSKDLTPEEILMLSLNPTIDSTSKFFPGYWEYSYNVTAENLFNNLVSNGYYDKVESIELTLENKTTDKLKEILRKGNLKVSGVKRVLIERILNDLPKDLLEKIEISPYYLINGKGKKIVEENPHILFFHNSLLEISIYEAHNFKLKNPDLTPLEIAYELAAISASDYIKKGNWGLYRNLKHGLSAAEKKNKNYEKELVLLFEVCYLDLSGMGNSFSLTKELLHIHEKFFFPYENSLHTLAPGIVNAIREIKVKFNMSDLHLKEHFLNSLKDYQVPFHLFTKEESAQILLAELEKDSQTVTSIYENAEKRYLQNH